MGGLFPIKVQDLLFHHVLRGWELLKGQNRTLTIYKQLCTLCYWGQGQGIYYIKRTTVSILGSHTAERLHIYFHSAWRIWEEGAGGNLQSATVLRDRGRGWASRAETTCGERVYMPTAALWERQHVLDCELPASFLHKLVSHSMGAADCSMAAPGPMLSLCQDLTSLDYHHNIHQLSSTQPPLPPTPSLLPNLPLPILFPQSYPSSCILSEWHPLNLPNYLSSGHAILALFGQHILLTGWSYGAKRTSTGLPDCSPRRPNSLWHYQPFTAKFKTHGHRPWKDYLKKYCVSRSKVSQNIWIKPHYTRFKILNLVFIRACLLYNKLPEMADLKRWCFWAF